MFSLVAPSLGRPYSRSGFRRIQYAVRIVDVLSKRTGGFIDLDRASGIGVIGHGLNDKDEYTIYNSATMKKKKMRNKKYIIIKYNNNIIIK